MLKSTTLTITMDSDNTKTDIITALLEVAIDIECGNFHPARDASGPLRLRGRDGNIIGQWQYSSGVRLATIDLLED